MADFYISPTGDNGNAGTVGSPWRDLSYAVSNSSASDTINCASGAYPSDTGFTLSSARNIVGPNAGIPYDGSRSAEAVLALTSRITLSTGSDNTKIDGVSFDGSGNAAPVIESGTGWDADNVQITNNIFTGGVTAISMLSNGVGVPDSWIIRGNKIDAFTSFGMFFDPATEKTTNFLINNNFVVDLDGTTGSHGVVMQSMQGLTFTENHIKNCTRGFEFKGGLNTGMAQSALIENNVFESGASNPRYLTSFGNPADTTKVDKNVVFQNNELIWNSDDGSIWYSSFVTNAEGLTFKNNTLTVTGSSSGLVPFMEISAPLDAGDYEFSGNSVDTKGLAPLSSAFTVTTAGAFEAGVNLTFEANDISGYNNAYRFGSLLSSNVNAVITNHQFVVGAVTNGVNNNSSTIIDARNNRWGGTTNLPSGGEVDPITGLVANGDGVAIDGGNVRFDPIGVQSGWQPYTEPTERSLSGSNIDVADGEPAPTSGVSDSNAGQEAIELAQYEGAINVRTPSGDQKFVTKGGGSRNVESTLGSKPSENSGVVVPYNDNAGRFSEPGKA
jgi:hypothetical protein